VSDHEILVSFSRPETYRLTPVLVTRTMLLDMQTREARTLFKRDNQFGFTQIQDAILGRDYDQPGTYLIMGAKGSNPKLRGVYAVNGAPQRLPNSSVQTPQKDIFEWAADRLGNVRIGYGFTPDQQKGVLRLKDASGNWHDASPLLDREARVLALPTQNPNHYYVLMLPPTQDGDTGVDEFGLRHVYQYDVATEQESVLFEAQNSEVAQVLMDLKGEEIVMVRFHDEGADPLIFDDELSEIYATLKKQFPDAWIGLESVSDNLSRAVVSVSSPKIPGALYVYDAEKRELAAFRQQYPGLAADELAEVYAIEYPARDGLTIPAYLTLPHGLSPKSARKLPFVVLPHGGPHARDFRRFDWMAQMLANQGYGVMQMNFRGSTGYGIAFEKAGRKRWGDAMVNDVGDGAWWLLKQGLADQERICIVGASFGGYATLMGVVREPRLYKCGVSLNGVADMPKLLRRHENLVGGRFLTRHIGQLWEDKASLHRSSPINSVKSIEVPLMIVASESDVVVSPVQSREMYNALKKSNKAVEFVELPKGDHYLSREENRRTFARALLRFLDAHIGEPQQRLAHTVSSLN
jgi:acetyl esterase/lipase